MVKQLIWREASLDLLCSIYRLRLANNLQDIQFGRVLILYFFIGLSSSCFVVKRLAKTNSPATS